MTTYTYLDTDLIGFYEQLVNVPMDQYLSRNIPILVSENPDVYNYYNGIGVKGTDHVYLLNRYVQTSSSAYYPEINDESFFTDFITSNRITTLLLTPQYWQNFLNLWASINKWAENNNYDFYTRNSSGYVVGGDSHYILCVENSTDDWAYIHAVSKNSPSGLLYLPLGSGQINSWKPYLGNIITINNNVPSVDFSSIVSAINNIDVDTSMIVSAINDLEAKLEEALFVEAPAEKGQKVGALVPLALPLANLGGFTAVSGALATNGTLGSSMLPAVSGGIAQGVAQSLVDLIDGDSAMTITGLQDLIDCFKSTDGEQKISDLFKQAFFSYAMLDDTVAGLRPLADILMFFLFDSNYQGDFNRFTPLLQNFDKLNFIENIYNSLKSSNPSLLNMSIPDVLLKVFRVNLDDVPDYTIADALYKSFNLIKNGGLTPATDNNISLSEQLTFTDSSLEVLTIGRLLKALLTGNLVKSDQDIL